MPWLTINDPQHGPMQVHVRMPKQRPKRCTCGKLSLEPRLCDFKMGPGKTCDAPCCAHCAIHPALGRDICPAHAEALAEWMEWALGYADSIDPVAPIRKARQVQSSKEVESQPAA